MVEGYVLVPAREGRAIRVSAGERFRVIDLRGGQVVDLFAFAADDPAEFVSASHTRVEVDRLFPLPGQSFLTNQRRAILLFEDDHSPGVHDMLMAACDPRRYELLGAKGWHASCQENLQELMVEMGFESVPTPQPINLFMNVRVEQDGSFTWGPAPTEAGDYAVFRAGMDAIVVACACPQDLNPINLYEPGPAAIEVLK